MLSVESAEVTLRKERIRQAVDVSAALDNCFFHSLALYYLANDLPFPDDLFAGTEKDTPTLAALKNRFPTMESLDLFRNYAAGERRVDMFPHHLVEKTIILGIFLRSWFTLRLSVHEENCQALFKSEDESQPTLMYLVKGYHTARLNDLAGGQGNVSAFLEQAEDDPIFQVASEFIRELPSDYDEETCRSYWESVGYTRYCSYLNANVKMSYNDVKAILNDLQIPHSIYHYQNAELITEHRPEPQGLPVFELALDGLAGHYYLLKTEQTGDLLESYKAQYDSYKNERIRLLQCHTFDHVTLAKRGTSQFLAATLPFTNTGRNPLDLVVIRVRELDRAISGAAAQENRRPNSNNTHARSKAKRPNRRRPNARLTSDTKPAIRFFSPLSTRLPPASNLTRSADTVSPVVGRGESEGSSLRDGKSTRAKMGTIKHEETEALPKSTPLSTPPRGLGLNKAFRGQIRRVRTSLDLVIAKKSEYERKRNNPPDGVNGAELEDYINKYDRAMDSVENLHKKILTALDQYEKGPNKTNYLVFKEICEQAITDYRPEIANHRDDHQFYGNLLGFILGFAVFYGLFLIGNIILNGGRCTMFSTDGALRVDNLHDDINAMSAPAA